MTLKKVLVLTSEYPPKIGSIAHACEKLVLELGTQDLKVDVITWDDWRVHMEFEDRNSARIHYIAAPILPASNTITFFSTLNVELARVAASIFHESKITPDIIHVHEWISVQAGISLKSIFNTPLILTLYSLENHRSHGASSPFNQSIKAIERKGIQAALKVIVFSKFLKDEVVRIYDESEDKICVMNLDEDIGSQTVEIYNEMLGKIHSTV
jgi:glycosyltransferase involved in cell wall biosynthesis